MSYLDDFCEKSKSEIVKAIVEGLTPREKQAFTQAVRRIIDDNAAEATVLSRKIARELADVKVELSRSNRGKIDAENKLYKYKGFYDTIMDTEMIEWGGRGSKSRDEFGNMLVMEGYLSGVQKAVDYITNRPDQIVQHLQDPNPKDKDVNINYRNVS